MSEPQLQSPPASPERIARFDAALAQLQERFSRLSISHALMVTIGNTILAVIPSWLQIGPIVQFLSAVKFFDEQYTKMSAAVSWFDKVKAWADAGLVAFRVSENDTADLDIVILSELVPVPVFAQQETPGSNWAVIGSLAAIEGLKITTDFLATQEETYRKNINLIMLGLIRDDTEAGNLTESTAKQLGSMLNEWGEYSKPGPDTIDKIITVLKWGAGIAIGIYGINVALKIRKSWQEEG